MPETEDYAKAAAPEAHATSHQDGGSDEINVAALSGELGDEQKSAWTKVSGKPTTFTPSAHASSHEDGGSDEISVAALSGELDDEQKSAWTKVSGKPTTFTPSAHASSHEDGGSDEISIPAAHDYVKVSDVKAYNVNGGTFTSGAWRTRDINTEDSDDSNICSISSNQITLAVGTYECFISCPAYRTEHHIARLYNFTDSGEVLLGCSERSYPDHYVSNRSFVVGKFTITAEKVFEIQHYCKTTSVTYGLGVRSDIAGVNSIFTVAEFRRVR